MCLFVAKLFGQPNVQPNSNQEKLADVCLLIVSVTGGGT